MCQRFMNGLECDNSKHLKICDEYHINSQNVKFYHIGFCKLFLNTGICKNYNCSYYHPKELLDLLITGRVKSGYRFKENCIKYYPKMQICKSILKSKCKKCNSGKNCTFFHLPETEEKIKEL